MFHGSLISGFVGFYLHRWWFISIVPTGCNPGTDEDIDFYNNKSSINNNSSCLPPSKNWAVDRAGSMPALKVYHLPVS